MRNVYYCALLVFMVQMMLIAVHARAEGDELCGVYNIQGWEPDGDTCSTPDYIGAIELSKKGGYYVYQGSADNFRYEGIGTTEQGGRVLCFAYRGTDGDVGQTRCENKNGIWVCQWISMNTVDGKPGKEIWKKQVIPTNAVLPQVQE